MKILELQSSDIQFASIVSNLLDNAIEACRSMRSDCEKFITFQIKPYHKMLYISMKNSTSNYYNYNKDGSLKSSKKEENHGIGLRRIQDTVNKANGFCQIAPDSDVFSVTIMIPISDRKEPQ